MLKLTRFWFEFSSLELSNSALYLGCGVTAWTYDDAINILRERIFKDIPILPIKKATENIDILTLDDCHVRANMLPPGTRGIWFPIGFD